MNTIRILLVLATVVVAGCASAPPATYYTLDFHRASTATPPVNLDVDFLRPAEALSRANLLVRTDPTRIEYYNAHQWASSLNEIVREKLEIEFGPDRDALPTLFVQGDILAFGEDETSGGKEAHVKLELAFRRADSSRYGDTLLERTYEARVPAASTEPNDTVVALSRAVEQIAAEILEDAASIPTEAASE